MSKIKPFEQKTLIRVIDARIKEDVEPNNFI